MKIVVLVLILTNLLVLAMQIKFEGDLYDVRKDMAWHITATLEPCP